MNYNLLPSLEHLALARIAIVFWNHDHIKALINEFDFLQCEQSLYNSAYQQIEVQVKRRVQLLSLPKSIKKKILGVIKPVGVQIWEWVHHLRSFDIDTELSDDLCWTPRGTVDRKKSAEIVIKDESLNITDRYKLACMTCLEDSIVELWNRMPENYRIFFYSEENPINVKQLQLIVLWTYDIRGEVAKMMNVSVRRRRWCSPYHYAFEYAVESGNKAASQYFWKKLTPEEKEKFLMSCEPQIPIPHAGWETYPDTSCFLLSQMNAEEQLNMLKYQPYLVFSCLLNWPYQSLFMETVNRMWDFISEEFYDHLLQKIVYKEMNGYSDYNYQNLFRELWQISPDRYKKFIIGTPVGGYVCTCFVLLLEFGNIEYLSIVLNTMSVVEKEELFLGRCSMYICECLAYSKNWDFVTFVIYECISSQEMMIKFKEKFNDYISLSSRITSAFREKFCKISELLDDRVLEFSKRECIKGNSSVA